MEKKKQKGSLLLLIIKIIFLFLVTDFVVSNVPALMTQAVSTGKYGLYFIVEMFAVLVVFIVMLLSKNQYVFTEKKEDLLGSLMLGIPILVITILMLIINIPAMFEPEFNVANVITLALFCVSIGLYEEFLCRGWLLNEFLEKYGNTRKQVIVSIVLSALVFGLMHISNIWIGGQTITETILQILQATAVGILFGGIYFRTKNIWSVVFLHGFYDFAIMLGSVNTLKDCHVVEETLTLTTILGTISIVAVYLLSSAIILRKSKINHLIKAEPKMDEVETEKSEKSKLIYLILIFMMITLPAPDISEEAEEICYEYEQSELKNYETHYSNYTVYEMVNEIVTQETVTQPSVLDPNVLETVTKEKKAENIITFRAKDNKLIASFNSSTITNNFDHPIEILVLEEQKESILFIHEQNQTSGESIIYFVRFDKNKITSSDDFKTIVFNELKKELVPDVHQIGYITLRVSPYKYPIMEVGTNQTLYLNIDDKLLLLK